MLDLFFDLDRTLWDFDRNSREALAEIFLEFAKPVLPKAITSEAFIAVYEVENERCWKAYREGSLTQQELRPLRFKRSVEKLGIPAFDGMDELSDAMGEAYVKRAPYRTALCDGAKEVCEALHSRGHRMFILTNGFEEVQHIKMQNSGLSPYFLKVLTSDALGYKKPKADAFAASIELTNSSPSNAIMIGDDMECDVLGAVKSGWKAIHYDPHGKEAGRSKTEGEVRFNSIANLRELLDMPLS
jgi:putative hydrolase of the HAD superfamily